MPSYSTVNKLNWAAAALHLGLFVSFGALFKSSLPPNKESVKLYSSRIDTAALQAIIDDPTGSAATEFSEINLPVKLVESGSVNVRDLVMAFFGVTFIAHLLYATDFFGTKLYSSALARGWNPFRWLEYGISASLMAALISPFTGVRVKETVGLIVASTAAMQGAGFLVERALVSGDKPDLTGAVVGTLVGWLLLITAWSAILRAFFQDLNDSSTLTVTDPSTGEPFKIPSWLWGIGVVQMAFFSCFGVTQLLHVAGVARASGGGKEHSFYNTEAGYLVLSLAAKATLASVVAYGLVQRTTVTA